MICRWSPSIWELCLLEVICEECDSVATVTFFFYCNHFCKSILQERDLSPICTLRPGRGLVQFCGRSWHSLWWSGWTDWHGCVSRMYTMGLIPMCMCLSTTSPTCDLGEGNSRGNMSLCLADDSCIFRAAKPRNQSASLQRFEYSERWKDIPCHLVILKPRLPWPGALPPPKKRGTWNDLKGFIGGK